ncbi:MAG: ABC transporter permease subunit [Candidatus Tenebribacter mawsonii]|nr:ABC transporter permease subunit [Candidatus Tenebribacter mawsonii]
MFTIKLNKSKILGGFLVLIFFIILAISLGISFREILGNRTSVSLLFSDLFISFWRVTIVAIIAWITGVIGGYLLYHSTSINNMFLPIINFIRHISPFAWLPFAIIWFGLGELPIIFIMFITLFFPTIIAASNHFSNLPHEYLDEGHVQGASQLQMFLHIELPLALSSLLNLFRIIWGLGWTVIIAAEMLGVNNGMGFRLLDFRYLLKYPEMLIYFIIMGFTGIIFDSILKKVINQYDRKI